MVQLFILATFGEAGSHEQKIAILLGHYEIKNAKSHSNTVATLNSSLKGRNILKLNFVFVNRKC